MFARLALFILLFCQQWQRLGRESRDIIGNMTSQEAALFAKEIDCTTVIPTHYDMMCGNEENPLLFAYYMEHTQPNRAWHILRNGEPYLYTY